MPSYLNDSLDTAEYADKSSLTNVLHVEIIQKQLSSASKVLYIFRQLDCNNHILY